MFWGIVIGCHVLGAFWNLSQGPWLLDDSKEYLFAATNLVEHQTLYASDWNLPEHHDDYSKRPPVYPILLILTSALEGNYLFLTLFQIGCSLLSIWLVSRVVSESNHDGVPWGLWAMAILLTPGQWMYPSLVMTEIWFQFLLVLLGIALIRALTTYKLKWWLTASVLIILGFLTKPVLYLFTIVFLGIGAFAGWKRKKLVIPLIAIIPLMSVVGYMSWNESRTGYFHVSSIQNLSLLQYTTTNLLIDRYGEEKGIAKSDSILYLSLSQDTYAEEQQQLQASCMSVLTSNLTAYTWMHARGMINFFLDPGRFDIWSFFQVEEDGKGLLAEFSESGYSGVLRSLLQKPPGWLLLLLAVLGMNLLKIIGMIIFSIQNRKSTKAFVLALIILYVSGLTGTSGAARFALPVFPFLLIGLTAWPRIIASSKRKALSIRS